MDLEKILEERAPELKGAHEAAIEQIRKSTAKAKEVWADRDLNDKAKRRKAIEAFQFGLQTAREHVAKQRDPHRATVSRLVREKQNLRLPEPPSTDMQALRRELLLDRRIRELERMTPEQRSQVIRQTAAAGDRAYLDAATDTFDGMGLGPVLETAWETWTHVKNNGDIDQKIEEEQAILNAVDVVERTLSTEARSLVSDMTRDKFNPKSGELAKVFEDALKAEKQRMENEQSREAFRQQHGVYPEETNPRWAEKAGEGEPEKGTETEAGTATESGNEGEPSPEATSAGELFS